MFYFNLLFLNFKSGIPFEVSRGTKALKTAGLEIMGIHLTQVAKRKGTVSPVIQQYVFVPFNRVVTIEGGDKYIEKCIEYILQIKERISKENVDNSNAINWNDLLRTLPSEDYSKKNRKDVAASLKLSLDILNKDKSGFLNLLENLLAAKPEQLSFLQLNEIISTYKSIETTDALLGSLRSPEILKSCLLTTLENIKHNHQYNIKIVEYGQGKFFRQIVPWIDGLPLWTVDYFLVTTSKDEELEDLSAANNVTVIQWDFKEPLPTDLMSAHLVIYHVTVFDENISRNLLTVAESIQQNGFILLHGATSNHSVAYCANSMLNFSSKQNQNGVRHAEKMLNESEVKGKLNDLKLDIISHVSSNLLNSLFLCRKIETGDEKSIIESEIDVTSFDQEWFEELKIALANEKKVLIKSSAWCNGVLGMVAALKKEITEVDIRYA